MSDVFDDALDDEARRLRTPVEIGPPAECIALQLNVRCRERADVVSARLRNVLLTVLEGQDSSEAGALEWWSKRLPSWFVDACADRSNPSAWSLKSFLYWFLEEERFWCWWFAYLKSETELTVVLVSEDFMAPTGALEWLFLAAGADTATKGG